MGTALSFRDVWVEYGDKIVLEKVTLDIDKGAFVSIVGPSGAGKSTFLRLTTGQEAPSRGRVLLDGEPLAPEPGPDRGVVFQRYSVFPHMNALENVVFGLECKRAPVLGKLFGQPRKPPPCSPTWASATRSPSIPANCRAGCSSAWPSPRP
jgi:NitT/TauT family transport system ATP-binding protein